MSLCVASAAREHMKSYRANGEPRGQCCYSERVEVSSRITVDRLLEWLDGPSGQKFKPYNIWGTNCQDFVNDLKTFLVTAPSTIIDL